MTETNENYFVLLNESALDTPDIHPAYYVGLFTVDSWREFKNHGGNVMGFNENKHNAAAKIKCGDLILCYLTKVSAFIGVIEVTGSVYIDHTRIWKDGIFPVRLPVNLIAALPLSKALPIRLLRGKLSFMPASTNSTGWTIYVRSSPRKWNTEDAIAVLSAVQDMERECISTDIESFNTCSKTTKSIKPKSFSQDTRVGRVIKKTSDLSLNEEPGTLSSYDNVLSYNKVTGYSVNVPISETCHPTSICLKTCYFAAGAPSWSNALRHQRKVKASIQINPAEFAERVAMEYDRLGLSFIRWNGGGDLFKESVEAINCLAKMRPDIVIWVVTRIPEWAAKIEDAPSVFIHFSLDKHSLARRKAFSKLIPKSSKYFFSYQCDKNEVPEINNLDGISVLFFDNYKPTTNLNQYPAPIVCPLNGSNNITGACEVCRKCFNGNAVKYRSTIEN